MTALWQHQEEGARAACQYPGYMLAHDMGTGKTCTAIEVANRIDARRVLILCPKTVISVWPRQFEIHSKKRFTVLPLDKGLVKAKAEAAKRLIRQHYVRPTMRIAVIVNYESAWRTPLGAQYNHKNTMVGQGVLLKVDWDLVIADESHRIKSPSSRASWFAYQFVRRRKAKKRLALTGTPMPHSPLDLYAQFRFLDPSIFNTNYHRFKMRYAKIVDLGDFKKIVGYQNLGELKSRFYTRAHRVEKSDVLDLPPTLHVQNFCELGTRAGKVYHMLKNQFVAWLDSGEQITAANILTKLLRLSQITGGYFQADEAKKGVFVDHAKVDLLEDLLLCLEDKEPAVIFCRFRPEIETIKKLCEKLGRHCAELSGSENQLEQWQRGQYDILAAQIRSGGIGVDLTRACYAFYFSTGYSLGDFDQSLARLDRPGQTRKVTYHHLLAENTIDVDIFHSLQNKRDTVDSVLKAVGRGDVLNPQPSLKEVS